MIKKVLLLVAAAFLCTYYLYADKTDDSNDLAHQATLFFSMGKVEEGMAKAEKACEVDPDNYVAWTLLAGAYGDFKKDYEKSIELFHKSLSINPDYDMTHFGLALVYSDKGMLEEARAEFARTIALTDRVSVREAAKHAMEELDTRLQNKGSVPGGNKQ